MKEKFAVNMAAPYGWFYQAGIHGTFWNTMKDLTKLASERGFGSPKQLESGDKILNNSTHKSGLRNEVARLGQAGSNEANAGGITPNFLLGTGYIIGALNLSFGWFSRIPVKQTQTPRLYPTGATRFSARAVAKAPVHRSICLTRDNTVI